MCKMFTHSARKGKVLLAMKRNLENLPNELEATICTLFVWVDVFTYCFSKYYSTAGLLVVGQKFSCARIF